MILDTTKGKVSNHNRGKYSHELLKKEEANNKCQFEIWKDVGLFKLSCPAVRESSEIYLVYIATHPLKELIHPRNSYIHPPKELAVENRNQKTTI